MHTFYILHSAFLEHSLSFGTKSRNMTSLKWYFLKMFSMKFSQNLMVDAKLMSYMALKASRDNCCRFWAIEKIRKWGRAESPPPPESAPQRGVYKSLGNLRSHRLLRSLAIFPCRVKSVAAASLTCSADCICVEPHNQVELLRERCTMMERPATAPECIRAPHRRSGASMSLVWGTVNMLQVVDPSRMREWI